MRSLLTIFLVFLLATASVEAGWFKSKSPVSDKLAGAEKATRNGASNAKDSVDNMKRNAKYQSDVAKAKAKKYKAGIEENAKKANKQAQETSQEAMERSAGLVRSFRNKLGAMFN